MQTRNPRTLWSAGVLACLSVALAGCVGDPAPAASQPDAVTTQPATTAPAAPAPSARANAPVPFTAARIRNANPPGTRLLFRIEATGAPPMYRWMHFVSGDAERTVIEGGMRDEQGTDVGPRESQESTWTELRDHASFPKSTTRRSEATCEVALGRFDCWLYVVDHGDEGSSVTSRFYFAKDRPGPPVLLVTETSATKMRMEMVEDSR